MISIDQLIETARGYLGVPYEHMGRSRRGLDCIGLFVVCAQDLGIPVWDDLTYTLKVNPKHLLAGIEQYVERDRPRPIIEPGRMALMQFSGEAGITHTALITERGILHAYNKRRAVVEHRLNDQWTKRIIRTYKINGVDYG